MKHPLISIDPSLTGTGVAVFDRSGELADMKRITAPAIRTKNKVQTRSNSWQRIDRIIEQLDEVLDETMLMCAPPPMIVIEITSGHTGARHGGGGAGLGSYGMCVGQVVRWAIERVGNENVMQVYENEWTRGSRKTRRQAHAVTLYQAYAEHWLAKDRGGDISDAIMLGEWAMNRINMGLEIYTK